MPPTIKDLIWRDLNRRRIHNAPIVPPVRSGLGSGGGTAMWDPNERGFRRPMKLPPAQDIGPGSVLQPEGMPQVPTASGMQPDRFTGLQGIPQPTGQIPGLDARGNALPQAVQSPLPQAVQSPLPERSSPLLNPIERELQSLLAARQAEAESRIEDDDPKLVNFYKGAKHAVRASARNGGDLGMTIGALIGGGLRGLFTKKEDEEREKAEKIAGYDKKIEAVEKWYDKDLERRAKSLANQGKQIANQIDLRKLAGEPIWEIAMKMKQITPAIAESLEQAGYPKLPVTSWQDIKEQMVNGEILQRPEFSNQYSPTRIIDTTKVPVPAISPISKTPVSLTSGQLYSGESTIVAQDAAREQAARIATRKGQTQYEKDEKQKAAERSRLANEGNSELNRAKALDEQIAVLQNRISETENVAEAGELEEKAITLRNKRSELENSGNSKLNQSQSAALQPSEPPKDIQPSRVGKPVPGSKDSLGLFR